MISDWKEVRLGDICEITSSKRVFMSDYVSCGIPFYRSKEIIEKHKGNNISTELFITEKKYEEIKNKFSVPSGGDILLTSVGTLGIPYIVKPDERFYFKDGNLTWIKKSDKLCPQFLYYFLCSSAGRLKLENISIGTTQKAITIVGLKSVIIPFPPVQTQQKIAKVLSTIDEKIELNNKINENLEQQAQAIFKSWFVDFESLGGAMPKDWEEGTISDIAEDIICGKTPSTSNKEYYGEDVPFITIPDMHSNVFVTKTERCLSKLGANSQIKKLLPSNSICVSCIATAGLVSLTSVESQTNQQINSIIPKSDISPYFIYLLLKSLSDRIIMLGSSGSTTCNLNKGQFAKIEIVIPDKGILNKYHRLVEPMFLQINNLQYENEQLIQLRDTLLPKLMSGEIDVEKVEV